MSNESGAVTWRVHGQERGEPTDVFDALILPHTATLQASGERHIGLSAPHEGKFDDQPHTLIVRARPGAGPLVVDYEVHGVDGAVRMRGRSAASALAVIVRSTTGILVTGLPDTPVDSTAPPT